MWYNSIMTAILRSPLHGILSKNTLLITVTGRKSGRKYTTPVNYYQQNKDLLVISKRERTWWRNLVGGSPVSLVLKGKTVKAFGEAFGDEAQVVELLEGYLDRFPRSAGPLHVRLENGKPDSGDLRRAARVWLFVRLMPERGVS